MSGNNYYYYPPNAPNFGQSWTDWGAGHPPYNPNYPRSQFPYPRNAPNAPQHHPHPNNPNILSNRPQYNSYNENNTYYPQRRFNNLNWPPGGFKRPRLETPTDNNSIETRTKQTKKKKKPLSQNVPSRRAWTLEDSKAAFDVEKEFYKHQQNHSLIIKFPDLEITKEIVSGYNSNIDYVHFQQSCMPRYCFVTLRESADPDLVIEEINKIPFGTGFLKAEYKKDREKEQNIGPEDIDPLTLYVGNLNHNVTKDDIVNTYPKSRRIDIGYAKKMKFTRYAIVSFRNVTDSIEAFKRTHNKDLNAKSLIVRFRRLNGSVGMPGESKTQSPNAKKKSDEETRQDENRLLNDNHQSENNGENTSQLNGIIKQERLDDPCDDSYQDSLNYEEMEENMYLMENGDDSIDGTGHVLSDAYESCFDSNLIDLSRVKKETNLEDEFDDKLIKIKQEFDSEYTSNSSNNQNIINNNKNDFISHKPLIENVKKEPVIDFSDNSEIMKPEKEKKLIKFTSLQENDLQLKVKAEPDDACVSDKKYDAEYFEINYDEYLRTE